jgi:hypothetical protein
VTGCSVAAESAGAKGVYFFDKQALPYINRADATLGRSGDAHFFIPLEDSAVIRDAASAYRFTGGAPSLERAYLSPGDVDLIDLSGGDDGVRAELL